ncbi:MAG: bifunctional diguanylate cyclase/phosphodiesterase [Pseudomonadota bacterium]
MTLKHSLLESFIEQLQLPIAVINRSCDVLLANLLFKKYFRQSNLAQTSYVHRLENENYEALCNLTPSISAESSVSGYLKLHDFQEPLPLILSSLTVKGEEYLLLQLGECKNTQKLSQISEQWLLIDRLKQSIINAKRANQSVAMMICRIARFNEILNAVATEHAHKISDVISLRIQDCVRDSDTVARLANDEFGLIFQVTNTDDGVIVANKILSRLGENFSIDGHDFLVEIFIGISLFPMDTQDAQEQIRFARIAAQHASETRQSNYEFFSNEMNTRAKSRMHIERKLRQALKDEKFILYYQPKVDSSTGAIVGAEGLIRWHDDELGDVAPSDFIPIAEDTGLIVPIGLWVLREACRQNMTWQKMGLPYIRVSVNVSSRQLLNEKFVRDVNDVLHESGMKAEFLELEITESMLVKDIDKTVDIFAELRLLGCHLSIDDFGTGYSSLSYLTRFPITTLKIDRAFIHGLELNDNTAEVARAIIGLSRGLNLEVVAEGAETQVHVEFLKQHGCDTVQGYFYSRPLPAHEFTHLLRHKYVNGFDDTAK